MTYRTGRNISRLACVATFVALTGCSEYLDRQEGIARTAGDAVRTNVAIHAIDPWPPRAANRSLSIGAERPVTRIRSYNTATAASAESGDASESKSSVAQ